MPERIAGDESYYTLKLVRYDGEVTPWGFRLPSVTSIIKSVLGASKGAMGWWGYNLAVEGVAAKLQKKPETIKGWLNAAGKNPNQQRDTRGDQGRDAHQLLEDLFTNKFYIQPSLGGGWGLVDSETNVLLRPLESYEAAVADFWIHMTPDAAVAVVERPLVSLLGGFSGTLDMALFWRDYMKGGPEKLEIVDLKTHKPASQGPPFAYEEDYIQVAAYADAWDETHEKKVDSGAVLLAKKDGLPIYEIFDLPKYRAIWRDVLSIYKTKNGGPEVLG